MKEIPFEERILAALSHIGIVMYLTGVILPGVVWTVYKDKSKYIKLQALQAMTFQLALMLAFMLGMVAYIASFGLIFLTAFMMPQSGIASAASIAVPFAIIIAILAIYAISIIYGLYAAYSTYLGRDFRYILIGNKIAEKLRQKSNTAP